MQHIIVHITFTRVLHRIPALQTEQTALTDLLRTNIQFQIPIYQRTYDWTRQNVRQLYDDIVRAGGGEQDSYHFIGAITCMILPKRIRDNVTQYQLIDGQQRITSLMLLLRALRDVHGEKTQFSDAMIDERLFNTHEGKGGAYYHKMVMFDDDDRAFREIMGGGTTAGSGNMAANAGHFTEWLRTAEPDQVWYGIKSLSAVVIKLETKDDAQAIFESMNSTGLDLSETDMIQNYMLMAKEPDWQKRIYEDYWRPMERRLGERDSREFDEFLRSYLMMRMKRSIPKRKIYAEFKEYMSGRDREEEIRDIYRHSGYYAEILGVSSQFGSQFHNLKREIQNIRNQDTTVANPLLLKVLADCDDRTVSAEDAKAVLSLLDSYLLRSYVCGTVKGGNKVLPKLISGIDPARYVDSIEEALMGMPATARYPRDAMFRDHLERFPLYMSRAICKYVLVRLEEKSGRGRLDPDSLEIEHIMPQTLTMEWKEDLGERWEDTHERYVHTIGNLTLTESNQEMGNSRFSEKKATYESSRLHMTRGLAKHDKWDEDEIRKRMMQLAEAATGLWPCPKGYDEPFQEEDLLEKEYLERTDVADLWHELKKEIQSSCTGMRFHMTHVYGAFRLPVDGGTREVGICSLEARLRRIYLTYNTKIGDGIIKPSDFVRDVSQIGTMSVGDLRSTITSENDIKRAVRLVRTLWESKSKRRIPPKRIP